MSTNRQDTADRDWPGIAAEVLARIRASSPRVHCITNEVAVNYSANALLAVGAIPSMTWQESEVADFVASANAVVINLGTLDPGRLDGIHRAIDAASGKGIPVVLDPVFVERSAGRLATARDLMQREPAIVRGNAAEFDAIGTITRSVQVMSGPIDRIRDGDREVAIHNGDPMMARVTATGCAATALLGACAAVCDDMFEASVSAALALGVAGEVAAGVSAGPGSLQINLLDALYALDASELMKRSNVK